MRHAITRGPPADGGYPIDSDLHQMTDDGCPLGQDPARWADAEWRDNLGEWDTFADEPRPAAGPAATAGGAVTIGRPVRTCPTAARPSPRFDPGSVESGDPPDWGGAVPPWPSVSITGGAAAFFS